MHDNEIRGDIIANVANEGGIGHWQRAIATITLCCAKRRMHEQPADPRARVQAINIERVDAGHKAGEQLQSFAVLWVLQQRIDKCYRGATGATDENEFTRMHLGGEFVDGNGVGHIK